MEDALGEFYVVECLDFVGFLYRELDFALESS